MANSIGATTQRCRHQHRRFDNLLQLHFGRCQNRQIGQHARRIGNSYYALPMNPTRWMRFGVPPKEPHRPGCDKASADLALSSTPTSAGRDFDIRNTRSRTPATRSKLRNSKLGNWCLGCCCCCCIWRLCGLRNWWVSIRWRWRRCAGGLRNRWRCDLRNRRRRQRAACRLRWWQGGWLCCWQRCGLRNRRLRAGS